MSCTHEVWCIWFIIFITVVYLVYYIYYFGVFGLLLNNFDRQMLQSFLKALDARAIPVQISEFASLFSDSLLPT